MNARNVATALAAWCGADDVNAAKLPLFYKEHASYKEHVQGAKAPGHAKGVRAFIRLHGHDLLTWRTDGKALFISALDDSAHSMIRTESDPISELAAKLQTLKVDNDPLQAVNDMLEPLKDGCSMRQFASQMKALGLCLANGEMYGRELPRKLKDKTLRISKANAKEFPLVKKCLVLCR
jgi:hypothetical protein